MCAPACLLCESKCIQHTPKLFVVNLFPSLLSLVSRIHFTFNSDQLLLLFYIFLSELHCFCCPFIILSYRDELLLSAFVCCTSLHIILHVSEPGPLMMMFCCPREFSVVLSCRIKFLLKTSDFHAEFAFERICIISNFFCLFFSLFSLLFAPQLHSELINFSSGSFFVHSRLAQNTR